MPLRPLHLRQPPKLLGVRRPIDPRHGALARGGALIHKVEPVPALVRGCGGLEPVGRGVLADAEREAARVELRVGHVARVEEGLGHAAVGGEGRPELDGCVRGRVGGDGVDGERLGDAVGVDLEGVAVGGDLGVGGWGECELLARVHTVARNAAGSSSPL